MRKEKKTRQQTAENTDSHEMCKGPEKMAFSSAFVRCCSQCHLQTWSCERNILVVKNGYTLSPRALHLHLAALLCKPPARVTKYVWICLDSVGFHYQVLGVTLERLARAKLAEAWREELAARENEMKLLQELEASSRGRSGVPNAAIWENRRSSAGK